MKERRGAKGSEEYSILGFRVPTTAVGERGKGSKGVKGGAKRILY